MLKETGTRSQTGRVPVFDVLCSILLYSGRIMEYDVKKPLKKLTKPSQNGENKRKERIDRKSLNCDVRKEKTHEI